MALAVGLVVGLERGWSRRSAPAGTRVAGLRSFGLLGLLGGLAALAPREVGLALVAAGALLVIIGYSHESKAPRGHSVTSALASLLTLGLGWQAASGAAVEALAAAAVMTLLLASRTRLHGWLAGLSAAEVEAVARFAIVALVILPLMPDRPMGPLDAWNPRLLWLLVVLVLATSFAGYALARRLGPGRGLAVTAAVGALVSSTAVTASYARRLGASDAPAAALSGGILLAGAVMHARVLLLVGLMVPSALATLALVLGPALLVQAGLAALLARRTSHGGPGQPVALGNPLEFAPALLLVAMVMALAVLARWLKARFGDLSVGWLLALTGLLDVDAAIVTAAGLPAGSLSGPEMGLMLALPVMGNSLWKMLLCLALPGGRGGLVPAAGLFAGVAVAALIWSLLG